MARQGYVNYGRRQKKRKNLGFFIISAITIVVLYIVVRQFWSANDEPTQPQSPATLSSEIAEPKPEPVRQDRVVAPSNEPRAVVKPQSPTTAVKPLPEMPAIVHAEDVVSGTAKETVAPVKHTPTEEETLAAKIEQITNMARQGKIVEARGELQSLLLRHPDSPQRLKIKTLSESLAEKWLFSDKVLAGDDLCEYYKVQSGDFLSKIGAKYDVPWEFLLKINNILRPEHLRAGQSIKVVNGPFNAVISRSMFTMDLYLDNIYIKSYKVGLGSNQHETPTGLWVVGQDKLVAPRWTDPDSGRTYDATDPDYPLGKRWIGLRGVGGNAVGRTGFALHGTNEPDSIGQRSSRGCIRLSDKDILEVYDLMMPGKSHIQIVD